MVRELCQASDILMKAICQRAPPEADKLIHNRDWLRGASTHPSAASKPPMIQAVAAIGLKPRARVMAEGIIGLFKTEVVKFLGLWKSLDQVEWEAPKWVDGSRNTRRHSAIE